MINDQSTAFEDRDVGNIGVSIGTSLAIENSLGVLPENPMNEPPILKFNSLYINLSTMFRNLSASLTARDQKALIPEDAAGVLYAEMSMIEGFVNDVVGSKVNVVFYTNDVGDLSKRYPHAKVKKPTTQKQEIYQAIHDDTLRYLVGMFDSEVNYQAFNFKMQGKGDVLLLTHVPFDLLSNYNFDRLVLLESHTGRLKPKSEWGSKLGAKDATLPFNEFMLQVFGDGSTFLSPLPIKHRKALLEVASKDKWSPITTVPRMKVSITKIEDRDIRNDLLNIIS